MHPFLYELLHWIYNLSKNGFKIDLYKKKKNYITRLWSQ